MSVLARRLEGQGEAGYTGMDRAGYVHKRKGRYMAQLLDDFEEHLQPRLPADVAEAFKVMVRRKMNALATDVCELFELGDDAMNGYARDMKDRLHADAAPPSPATREEARR